MSFSHSLDLLLGRLASASLQDFHDRHQFHILQASSFIPKRFGVSFRKTAGLGSFATLPETHS